MPEDPGGELLAASHDLMRLLPGETSRIETLRAIAGRARQAVPLCTMAGITLRRGDGWQTAAHTDETLAEVDKSQYETSAGPCVEAVFRRAIMRMDSATEEDRWPEFAHAAAGAGIASVISFPMDIGDEVVGALNLYAAQDRAFTDLEEETGLLFAQQAALACVIAERYWAARVASEQLQQALQSRDVIGQAKGILMERLRIDADAAFDLLRSASQDANLKLRDIAERVALTGEVPR